MLRNFNILFQDQSLASNAVLPCKKDNCANVKRPSISSLHAVATPGISKYMIQERNVKQSVVLENVCI